MFRTIRANILYGAIFLIPVAAFLLVGWYLFGVWRDVLLPFSGQLGLDTNESRLAAAGMALLALLIFCFILGAIVRTRAGTWTFEKLEANIFNQMPGYGIISNMLRGFADQTQSYPTALVTLVPGGAAALGFVMEDNGAAGLTVFVPSAPMMTLGQVYVVPREHVETIEGSLIEASTVVSQWGVGLQKFVGRGG